MVQFMTQGTLKNMPAYLAEDRARRAEEASAKEKEETAKQHAAMQKRMKEIGTKLMAHGDFTPQGVKNFAEENELSMPELKGMVELVKGFKSLTPKAEKKALVNTRPEGANYTQRTEDAPGVRSYDKPKDPSTGQAESVPDWMKYATSTLKSSLGYTQQSGWPDKKMQAKFDAVLNDVDTNMRDKDPKEVIKVLHESIANYDTKTGVSEAILKIPKDTMMTSANDAKVYVERAAAAGATPDSIKTELKAKGWDDTKIKKIMGGSDDSNPLGL